jgi:hypothetical protein
VAALSLLHEFGADLSARHLWLLQGQPRWTLVHAAAFNGNLAIMRFLEARVPSLLHAIDDDGNNGARADRCGRVGDARRGLWVCRRVARWQHASGGEIVSGWIERARARARGRCLRSARGRSQ